MIGGKWSGLYNSQGNIKQGLSTTEKALYDRWVEAAIPRSAPFAAVQDLPPEVCNAISILLKAAR